MMEYKELREEGLLLGKITKQLHVSTTTANKYVKINVTEKKDTHITKRTYKGYYKVKDKVDRICILHKQALKNKRNIRY